jgi:hypothetical protein
MRGFAKNPSLTGAPGVSRSSQAILSSKFVSFRGSKNDFAAK